MYIKDYLTCLDQVLAHRGQHWTLLQNESRELWNCAHTALLHAYTPIPRGKEPGLINYDVLRCLTWEIFYVASDCLLDMLAILQVSLEKHAARVSYEIHLLTGKFA